MKTLNGLIIGLLLGLGAGLWMGINIGRDVPLTSNPFKEPSLADRVGEGASDLYDKTRDAINRELNKKN